MKFKYYLLLILILFMNSCDEDSEDLLCNTQDPNSYCYIPSPSANISSYNPHQLRVVDDLTHIDDEQINNAESLEVTKISSNSNDSTFTVSILDNTFEFLDSAIIGESYQYEMAYIHFNSESSAISNSELLTHDYQGVENLSLNLINVNQLNINWTYNYSDYFDGPVPNSINFKLIKDKEGSELEFFDLDLDSDILNYSYIDTDIEVGDILKYSIYMIDDNIQSEIVETNYMEVNFPDCFISNWIPLNSYTIYLEWECSDVINNNLPRITLRNQYTSENEFLFDIENSEEAKGFFIDDLSLYYDQIDETIAGRIIEYTLEWQGASGQSLSQNFELQTFPVHHMVYIPSLDQFPFGLESSNNIISNTKAFYIDKYEITNTQMENYESNPYIKWNDYPYNDGFNYDNAMEYCSNRGSAFGGLPFTLPDEIDWEIAASAEYQDIATYGLNFDNGNASAIYIQKYYYPTSVGNGLLNCNYANIQSCYDGTLKVGSFDGNDYQNSISPSGLYDCSGNVKEWVNRSELINHGQESRKILRGGSYSSEPDDAQNISFIYESSTTTHNSFGFRTIIYADDYIEILRNSHDKE